jgi:hypothetical protein
LGLFFFALALVGQYIIMIAYVSVCVCARVRGAFRCIWNQVSVLQSKIRRTKRRFNHVPKRLPTLHCAPWDGQTLPPVEYTHRVAVVSSKKQQHEDEKAEEKPVF